MTRLAPAALVAASLVTLAGPAGAQQPERPEGYEVVSDTQFAALGPGAPEGQKYNLMYVKHNKQFNELLKLHGSPLGERIVVRDPQLRQALLADQDSAGKAIPRRGNLQVLGAGQRVGQSYVLVATRVLAIESDLEHARRRAAALGARDAKGRTDLVRYMQSRLQRYYQDAGADQDERRELVRLMRQLEEDVRTIELEQLPALPGGADEHIEVGRRFKALNVLAQVCDHPEVPAEARARAEQVLTGELGAQRYLGRWYSHEDFKDLVNFVKRGDAWIPRDRADFLAACEAERRRLLKHEPLSVLPEALLRQAKDVVKGMSKDMALSVLQAYPTAVDRVREQLGSSNLVFEQWVMADGTRVYFVNGLVFEKVDPSSGSGGN